MTFGPSKRRPTDTRTEQHNVLYKKMQRDVMYGIRSTWRDDFLDHCDYPVIHVYIWMRAGVLTDVESPHDWCLVTSTYNSSSGYSVYIREAPTTKRLFRQGKRFISDQQYRVFNQTRTLEFCSL